MPGPLSLLHILAMILIPILIFLSVSLTAAGVIVLFAPGRTHRRLQALSPSNDGTSWVETIVGVVTPFANLSTPSGNWQDSPLRRRFLNAGIRHADAALVYFGAKTLLPLLAALLAYLLLRTTTATDTVTLSFYLMVAALLGCYIPNIVLHRMIRTRQRKIVDSFADAADLMLVCVEAGLGLDAGLTKVAEEIRTNSVELAEELYLTNLEMRAGASRASSLRGFAMRTGVEEITTFATMLVQADRFGTSIGDSLRVFSEDLRHKRQIRAEEAAAKVPTKMLFPLVICIFPAIIMVIMGPAAIQVLRILLPMIGGGMQ